MELIIHNLFTEEGPEIHIKSAALYVTEGEELSFWEVGCNANIKAKKAERCDFRQIMERATQRGHIAIGYRHSGASIFEINPEDKHVPQVWSEGDSIACVSEE